MEKTWWKESVVYQIYSKSFMDADGDGYGDIAGIISKLDYLKKLGVNVLWLSPIYESPEDDNGYDISNYRAILKRYGTMEDLERLLKEVHQRDMKVIMDLVVNHTSDQHEWFVESRKSIDNPYRDYYIWKRGKNGREPNNWGAVFGGSAWEYDEGTDMYYLHLFTKSQPDLNWDNEKVRDDIHSMMKWWCEKGIDGFRMDVISYISKSSDYGDGEINEKGYGDFGPYCVHGPNVHKYLREMNREVLSKYPLMTVGETAGVTVEEAIKYARKDGSELSMVFQFEHMDLDGGETFKWNLRKMNLMDLKRVLTKWQKGLEGQAWNSLYWCNHDQPRIVSRLGNDREEYRELSAKMLATCIHMMQGTPYVYQGEELGMTNAPFETITDFRDVESVKAYEDYALSGKIEPETMMEYLRYKSRDNARTPMQWSDEENGGFTKGNPWIMVNPNYKKINAREQLGRKDSVFHYYRKLIRLRRQYEIIVYGSYELIEEENPYVFAYVRTLDGNALMVACNFFDQEVCFDWALKGLSRNARLLLNNYGDGDVRKRKILRPYEATVWLDEKA